MYNLRAVTRLPAKKLNYYFNLLSHLIIRFLVAIAYDKGVVVVEEVLGRLNGDQWAEIIDKKVYNKHLNKKRTIIQDNDPVQNSKVAMNAFARQKIKLHAIPAKSPDVNVIENLFNTTKRNLAKEAIKENITIESKSQFAERCKSLLLHYSTKRINNLIDSLPQRMKLLIEKKGLQLKY